MGANEANDSHSEADEFQARRRHCVIALILLFVVTLIGVGLVDVFTFWLRPGGGMSGNGNPALLILFPLVPLYAVLLAMLGIASHRFLARGLRRGDKQALILIILILLGVALAVLEWLYISSPSAIWAVPRIIPVRRFTVGDGGIHIRIRLTLAPCAMPIVMNKLDGQPVSRWRLLSHSWGSANLGEMENAMDFSPECEYHQVQLGFVIAQSRTRWLTCSEIAGGVIEAMMRKQAVYTVGAMHPPELRPST
ncbi:hypothetical protein ABU162_13315 [Paenibacillus thiaminolyticus]|uniref:hypothetical protein n=1 Tax=Paenibacillus thiaminolyticus TaxID=49283 RepID=UPI0035A719AD